MVAHGFEPLALLGGEAAAGALLVGEPALEALLDRLLEGDELGVLAEREADQGDDVRQEALVRGAADLVLGDDLVSTPEPFRRPGVSGK